MDPMVLVTNLAELFPRRSRDRKACASTKKTTLQPRTKDQKHRRHPEILCSPLVPLHRPLTLYRHIRHSQEGLPEMQRAQISQPPHALELYQPSLGEEPLLRGVQSVRIRYLRVQVALCLRDLVVVCKQIRREVWLISDWSGEDKINILEAP